ADGYRFNAPLISCDFTPDIPALLECDNDDILIETIKPSQDGKGVVARLYDRYGEGGETVLKAGFRYKSVFTCNMLEEEREKLSGATLTFRPYEIKTLYFEI